MMNKLCSIFEINKSDINDFMESSRMNFNLRAKAGPDPLRVDMNSSGVSEPLE